MQSAGREPVVGEEALSLLDGIDELVVAKGRKIVAIDLTEGRPDDEALLDLLLGRSGKLRAPTLKVGARLIVGFNGELLEQVLG